MPVKPTAETSISPVTVELKSNDPTLTVHKCFLHLNLNTHQYHSLSIYDNVMHVTRLTPEQIEWLKFSISC